FPPSRWSLGGYGGWRRCHARSLVSRVARGSHDAAAHGGGMESSVTAPRRVVSSAKEDETAAGAGRAAAVGSSGQGRKNASKPPRADGGSGDGSKRRSSRSSGLVAAAAASGGAGAPSAAPVVASTSSSSSSSSKAEMMRRAAFRTPAEGLTRLSAILRVPSMAVLASTIQLATALASMSRRLERMAAGGESWGAPPNAAPTAESGERPKHPQTSSPPPTAQVMRRRHKGLTEWKALLCTLIADREVKSLRHDAKRLLRRLCVTQAAYHGVRDSYQFTAELRKVLHSLPPRAARAACEALRDPAAAAGSSSSTRDARGKKRRRWDDAPPCSGQGVASAAAAVAAGGGGGAGSDDDELPYTTQVALHRSLTSLLHVAEMRPTNWRRYCAVSWSSKYPRFQGDAAAA
ncbi:unnamed protein product, partial [Ectocarpus sp. 8 AP-2014]